MIELDKVAKTADGESVARVKAYGVSSALVLSAFATSLSFGVGALIPGIIALVVFLAVSIIQSMLSDNKKVVYLGIVFSAAAFTIPFYKSFSITLGIAFVLLTLFLFSAFYRGRKAIENMIKMRFFRISHIVSESLITAVVIFFTTVLIVTSGLSVSRERIDQLVKILVVPVVERQVEGFTPGMSVGEMLSVLSEDKLSSDPRFISLPDYAKEEIIKESAEESKQRIEEIIGVEIDANDTIGGNIHNVIQSKLSDLTPAAKIYWGAAIVMLAWLSVKSVEFILYIPLAVLTLLIYELLLSLNFISIELESRSKEVVSLK